VAGPLCQLGVNGMIGRTILHYKILEEIGEGGMGVVYKAEDTRLDRLVALKFLPAELSADPERLQRLEREAKAVAALNHPSIVTLHSFESAEVEGHGEVHFLTMELVEGQTLAEMIPARGLGLEKLLEISIPLAEAVAVAHRKGITHRDLKPANILITASGRVKVLDFGLAKLRPDTGTVEATALATERAMTEEGRVLGTVPYMSPEQLQGKPLDPRSDIFALGVILYEMSTGERPFAGETSADVMSAILRDVPQPATELRGDMPRHLGRVIRRCLEKDPERRYQSAIDVRNELEDVKEDLATGDGLGSMPMPSPKLPRRRGRPRWGRYALAIGGAAAVITAIIVAMSLDDFRERLTGGGGPRQIRSLAVLPFDNLMNDPEQDYFVDGMQEALITDLSKVSALKITSRTSVLRFKGTDMPMSEIAALLNVDALVEGSVLRVGDQVRITAQLIDASTDTHLWGDDYDRDLSDVLLLLSEVAETIAGEIEVVLTPQQQELLGESRTVDPAAYEAYLRGMQQAQTLTSAGLERSIELFLEAIEIDPTFAPAHAGLGMALALPSGLGWIRLDEDRVARARGQAEIALGLDEQLSNVHVLMGYCDLWFDWDWPAAERAFLRALELKPNDSFARHGYADALLARGEIEESLRQVELGRQFDPLSLLSLAPVIGHLYMARHYDEMPAAFERLEEVSPGFDRSYEARALWQQGRREEAYTLFRQDYENRGLMNLVETLDRGHSESGPDGAMLALAERQALQSESTYVNSKVIAALFAMVGEVELALDWLERAYDERIPLLILTAAEPDWDILRDEPRFQELLRKLGLPE